MRQNVQEDVTKHTPSGKAEQRRLRRTLGTRAWWWNKREEEKWRYRDKNSGEHTTQEGWWRERREWPGATECADGGRIRGIATFIAEQGVYLLDCGEARLPRIALLRVRCAQEQQQQQRWQHQR